MWNCKNIPFTVIAIFFAVRLNKAKLPEWVDWILIAYVVFYILIHLILTVRLFLKFSRRILKKSRENLIERFINA